MAATWWLFPGSPLLLGLGWVLAGTFPTPFTLLLLTGFVVGASIGLRLHAGDATDGILLLSSAICFLAGLFFVVTGGWYFLIALVALPVSCAAFASAATLRAKALRAAPSQ